MFLNGSETAFVIGNLKKLSNIVVLVLFVDHDDVCVSIHVQHFQHFRSLSSIYPSKLWFHHRDNRSIVMEHLLLFLLLSHNHAGKHVDAQRKVLSGVVSQGD